MTKVFNKTGEKAKRRTLRKNMPPAEVILWFKLKGKGLKNYKFRRQYGIGKYVVDFYCPALKLAIEIDGDSHFIEGVSVPDRARQIFIESFGITVLRFTNRDIHENLEGVLERIMKYAPNQPPPAPPW